MDGERNVKSLKIFVQGKYFVKVIQRRGQYSGGQLNFTRSWADYKAGFGDLNGEFWSGNDFIR